MMRRRFSRRYSPRRRRGMFNRRRDGIFRGVARSPWERGEDGGTLSFVGSGTTYSANELATAASSGSALRYVRNISIVGYAVPEPTGTFEGGILDIAVGLADSEVDFENRANFPEAVGMIRKQIPVIGVGSSFHIWSPRGFNLSARTTSGVPGHLYIGFKLFQTSGLADVYNVGWRGTYRTLELQTT